MTAYRLPQIAATLTLFALSGPLWAENALARLDTNDDGVIGRQEAMAAQVEAFHRLDADDNGRITRDEMTTDAADPSDDMSPAQARRARAQANERRFDNLDQDASGDITLDEYQAAMTPYFDRLDADDDGALSGAELRSAIAADKDAR